MTKPLPGRPGRGGHQRLWTRCKHGHPMPLTDPPGSRERKCQICNRIRADEQYAAISAAARLLGMTQRQYHREYGYSGIRAVGIIARLEAEANSTL